MESIDIIPTSSVDIPYEDSGYKSAKLQLSSLAVNNNDSTLECTRVLKKTYQTMTYWKLSFPCGLTISSEEEIFFIVERTDGFGLQILVKIKNNIITYETEKMQWYRWEINNPKTIDLDKYMREIIAPNRNNNSYPPIWIQRDSTTDPGIRYIQLPGTTSDGTTITLSNAGRINNG